MTLFGYQVIETPCMCDTVQARTHKKKRINKKWRKRYGMKKMPWRKLIVAANGRIYGHPEMIAWIKEEMKFEGPTQ